jgi:hypothetical protein
MYNTVAGYLTNLIRIWEVLGSKLGMDTCCEDEVHCAFLSGKCQANKLGNDRFLPHFFQFFIHNSLFLPLDAMFYNFSYFQL